MILIEIGKRVPRRLAQVCILYSSGQRRRTLIIKAGGFYRADVVSQEQDTMATQKRLLKEFRATAGDHTLPETIITLHPVSEENLYKWRSVIHIGDTSKSYYSGAYFQL